LKQNRKNDEVAFLDKEDEVVDLEEKVEVLGKGEIFLTKNKKIINYIY
jgi:hypothetical protein